MAARVSVCSGVFLAPCLICALTLFGHVPWSRPSSGWKLLSVSGAVGAARAPQAGLKQQVEVVHPTNPVAAEPLSLKREQTPFTCAFYT